jgi:2-polyprenyl-3-methyl-5-hydroxy-6-metoxy-1,4-benzoquinol methylase
MDRLRFYNWIARPEVSAVMHSMKAGAIAASGTAVAARLGRLDQAAIGGSHLPARSGGTGRPRRILDLGCAHGYLTTWYALQDRRREVTGVDFSKESVVQARRMARRLGVRNVKFTCLDLARDVLRATYDVLVDTQTLQDLEDLDRVFAGLARLLRPGGFLLSVPALATARDAKRFVRSMIRGGFALRSCDFIFFSDCSIPSAYPVITGSLGEGTIEPDFARLYQEILDALTRPCYPNL